MNDNPTQSYSWPEHKNPSPKNQSTAPYNFIRLPQVVITVSEDSLPPRDIFINKNRYHGYFQCQFTTETPLFIRCGTTLQEFQSLSDEDRLSFFYYTNPKTKEPVIPGSSLRGMIRTLVEILSFSKIIPVSSEKVYARSMDPSSLSYWYRGRLGRNIKAGYILMKGKDYHIIPALKFPGVPFSWSKISFQGLKNLSSNSRRWGNTQHAQQVTLRNFWIRSFGRGRIPKIVRDNSNADRTIEAVIIKTGEVPGKKHHLVIGLPSTPEGSIPIPDNVIETYQYRNQVTDWIQKNIGSNGVLFNNCPIFYILKNLPFNYKIIFNCGSPYTMIFFFRILRP